MTELHNLDIRLVAIFVFLPNSCMGIITTFTFISKNNL